MNIYHATAFGTITGALSWTAFDLMVAQTITNPFLFVGMGFCGVFGTYMNSKLKYGFRMKERPDFSSLILSGNKWVYVAPLFYIYLNFMEFLLQ